MTDTLRRYRYPIAVWAGSRVCVYLLLFMEGWTSRRPRNSGFDWDTVFRSLGDWDATWYRWIAQNGYDPSIGHGNTAAFFPLFPLLWRPLTWLPGPVTMWGSLLSSALLLAALCLLYRMTQGRFDEGMARRTVLYLAIFPLTFVFSLPYAESLFLLLVLGAFALTWHGRWWWGCVAAAGAAIARPTGIALLPALAWRTGDVLASAHAQERGWGRGVSVLPIVFGQATWDAVSGGHLRFLVHAAFTLLWCFLIYWGWRMKLPGEYLIYSALLILLPTTGGLLVSMGRFGMVGFPMFWALADLGRDERVDTVVKVAFPLLLAALIFITFGPRTFTP